MTRASQLIQVTVSAPSGVPEWWTGLAERTWVGIAGGTSYSGDSTRNGKRIADVLPSNIGSYSGIPQDVTRAYTGGCVNQTMKEVYLPAQGGHGALSANMIFALKLNQTQPAWERIKESSAPASILGNNPGTNAGVCKNSDNTPRAHHGWYQDHCDGSRIWLVGTSAPFDDGTGTHQSSVWSIARGSAATITDNWVFHGRYIVQSSQGGPDTGTYVFGSYIDIQAGPGAYDSSANKIYKCGGFDITGDPCVKVVNCATVPAAGYQAESGNNLVPGLGRWGGSTPGGNPFGRAASFVATDKTPRCWIIPLTDGSNSIAVFDVATPGAGFVFKTPTGSRPPDSLGALYVPAHSAAYFFGTETGATVYKLTITGSNPLTATYAWSTLTNNAGSATPVTTEAQYQGTFGKAQGILDMGDGRAALVIASSVSGPSWVYKLPAS